MRSRLPFLVVLGIVALVLGQTPTESSAALLASLPTCAQTCLISSLSATTCAPTNQTCLCGDQQFTAVSEACVMASCTVKEQLTTKNATQSSCGFEPRDRGHLLWAATAAFGIASASMALVRLGFKLFVSKVSLCADDWALVASLFIGVPGTVIICQEVVPSGIGRDVWTLSPDEITRFGMWFYVMEIQYFTNLTAVKLSLLLFYLRIFPSQLMRRLLWGTIVFDLLFGTAFVVTAITQCIPTSYFWTMWDGEHEGHCININAVGWANAAISIALDFWMLALPLSQINSLRLHWKKKLAVALMFMVGTFVTVVSILRLRALVSFSASSNLTQDNFDVHLWSAVEINVAIMCACMPAMRQALAWACPVVFGTATVLCNGSSANGSAAARSSALRRKMQSSGSGPGGQLRSESKVALSGPDKGSMASASVGSGFKFGRRGLSSASVKEITSPRSMEFEQHPNSPVLMTELSPVKKSDIFV